jgi:hypothetical protein
MANPQNGIFAKFTRNKNRDKVHRTHIQERRYMKNGEIINIILQDVKKNLKLSLGV